MDSLISLLKRTDWIANALAILTPVAGLGFWLWRREASRRAKPRSFVELARASARLPIGSASVKSIAKIAIVDDNISDFPVADLRKAGFQITTYKHVSVADFDKLAEFDVVFLDMYDIVKDDPTEGGLKLIRVLRQKNPRQKICAVSGNQFNPSATAFFKLADDALNKPMSAQRCVDVLDAFLKEKLDAESLALQLDEVQASTEDERNAVLTGLAASISHRRVLGAAQVPVSWPAASQTALIDLSRLLTS